MLFIAALLAAVVLALLVWFLFPVLSGRSLKAGEERLVAMEDSSSTLHYRVPDGQDPAVLTAALSQAGYLAESHLVEGHNELLIEAGDGGPPPVDDVRREIEAAHYTSLEGGTLPTRVVFEEER